MLTVHRQHVQVTPSDRLFLVERESGGVAAGGGHDEQGCTVHLALTREAAFGHCLAPYRPCGGFLERLDAYLGPGEDEVPFPPPGTLSWRFFDERVLRELRFVEPARFEPVIRHRRFGRMHSRFVRQVRVGATRLGVASAGAPIGSSVRLSCWDYLGVWELQSARTMLEVRRTSSIDLGDRDVLVAAERLGITLT